MLAWVWLSFALGAGSQTAIVADDVTKGLLQRAQYEQVKISPDGQYLAIAHHEEHGTTVTVLDRKSLEQVSQIDPGNRGEVTSLAWLGSEQLLVAANRRDGTFAAPVVAPELFLLNIHETHAKPLPDSFSGVIEGDDHHILVTRCKFVDNKCLSELFKLDTHHLTSRGESITVAPVEGAEFLIDHAGQPRFTWAVDEDGIEKLYERDSSGQWQLINDSKSSQVYVEPKGISRDNKFAFLITEQKSGPDVIQRYNLADNTRQDVLRDTSSDPLGLIFSLDQLEPIGANFGPGRPMPRFFNGNDTDAQWRRALGATFADSLPVVISASADGNLLIVETTSDRDPGSFYLFDKQAHKAQLLFHAKPWLDLNKQLPTESFSIKARDGLMLNGFMTLPAQTNHLPPMVVMVHGGPFYIRDDWDYNTETQLLAQHGYAVLRVNYRGSSGFGRDFMERGYRQWGAAMQDDVTDATHWAIDKGLADGKRVCIYGGSYGGYAALMGAAREPQLYRCVIGMAGVYDLNRMYTWGDIHRNHYGMVYLKTVLGQDKTQLAARSPVELASSITVPVLLAHGTLDGRVPIQHAQAMRDALRKAGHPPLYFEYTWEGHGLYDEEHRKDFYTRMLQFLDANIGDAPANPVASH